MRRLLQVVLVALVLGLGLGDTNVAKACCVLPPEPQSVLRRLATEVEEQVGTRAIGDSELSYQLKLNQAYLSHLVVRSWPDLMALESLPDEQLCDGACTKAKVDLRRLLSAAITLKSANDSTYWNREILVVGLIAAMVSFVGVIAGTMTILWIPSVHIQSRLTLIKVWAKELIVEAIDEYNGHAQAPGYRPVRPKYGLRTDFKQSRSKPARR